jgi:syntaxin 1B/2/3
MMLGELPALQKRCLADADTSADSEAKRRLDLYRQDIMDQYRALADRVRTIKSKPESRQPMYARQVERAEGRLRDAIQEFQKQEAVYRQETNNRLGRQLRIVRPDATDAEIREAVDTGNTQVFQQAVMGSRSEQATRVLGAVQRRHEEILQIERSMMELLDLLNDMNQLLVKQEVTVNAIDTHAEQAAEDMGKANEELEVAVTTARKTRKKKWICLGICGTSLPKNQRNAVTELTCDHSSHYRYHRGCRCCLCHG